MGRSDEQHRVLAGDVRQRAEQVLSVDPSPSVNVIMQIAQKNE